MSDQRFKFEDSLKGSKVMGDEFSSNIDYSWAIFRQVDRRGVFPPNFRTP